MKCLLHNFCIKTSSRRIITPVITGRNRDVKAKCKRFQQINHHDRGTTGGFTQHKSRRQTYLATDRPLGLIVMNDHPSPYGFPTDLVKRLFNRSQRRIDEPANLQIVKAGNSDVFRHRHTLATQRLHTADRHGILKAKNSIRALGQRQKVVGGLGSATVAGLNIKMQLSIKGDSDFGKRSTRPFLRSREKYAGLPAITDPDRGDTFPALFNQITRHLAGNPSLLTATTCAWGSLVVSPH